MDYAEGRLDAMTRVAERLTACHESDTRPIRLVLLARAAEEWWEKLHDETVEVRRVFRGARLAPDVSTLPAISTGEQSLRAFGRALAAQGKFCLEVTTVLQRA